MIGQLLAGHYRVLEVLGAGGFGQTYITEDLHLPGNPKCVLKHLKPASSDPALLAMARQLFDKEAVVLQQLGTHDRIPRLFAYFEQDQEFYLVQEYAIGHTLTEELKGKKWQEPAVIELLEEVLDILVFIHSKGVIHRDIKPDNIIRRDSDRHLVLIDFGAIKQVRNQQALNGQQTMTVSIGTPGYMPIEQASGTPRAGSDLYALGTIAIEALTGINPYNLEEDERTGERKWEHLTAANPQLIAVVGRMTRYHFKDRYLSAAEALQAVRAVKSGTYPAATYVQQTQPAFSPPPNRPPQQPTQAPIQRPNVETQPTLVVSPRAAYTPPAQPAYTPPVQPAYTPPRPKAPGPNLFPLFAGVGSIAAAVGSFVWFSNTLLNQRNFATDLKSELCRVIVPTSTATVRVRSTVQRNGPLVTSLRRGAKVVYIAENSDSVNIQFADDVNSKGWVYSKQLTACPTPIPIATPTETPTLTPSPIEIPVPTPNMPMPEPIQTPTPIVPSPPPIAIPRDTPRIPPSPVPIRPQMPSPSPIPNPDLDPFPMTPPQDKSEPKSAPKENSGKNEPNSAPKENSGKNEKDTPTPTKTPSEEQKAPLY